MGLKDNIKDMRALRQMTLEEVAAKVGVSRQTIQKYESGLISNIPSDKIEKLAAALETTPAFLMGWEKDSAGDSRQYSFTDGDTEESILKASLLSHFDKLNPFGKREAVTRLEEMTEIGKFTKKNDADVTLYDTIRQKEDCRVAEEKASYRLKKS